MTKDEKIKEVMALVYALLESENKYSSELALGVDVGDYARKSIDTERAIESKLRELIQ